MPVVTSFGSLISVSVWPEGNGDTFLVSDDGLAYHEVNSAAASDRTFTSVASNKAKQAGAHFDGCSLLFMRVNKNRLKGSIIAMAELTKQVIDETIEKSFAAKHDQARERFIRTASEAFANYDRTESATVRGYSNAEYEIDLLVHRDQTLLAFDYFSKSGNSVNSAYVKLSDLSRLEGPPTTVGVTKSISAIGPKLSLISSVSQIIEADAPPARYLQLAA
ncbi:MAG: hypothetical protein EpisKO_06280 [Epibacterium sp.]